MPHRRGRRVLLGIVALFGLGEAWWWLTTPAETSLRSPNAYKYARIDFAVALARDPALARRIGYVGEDARRDEALRRRAAALMKTIQTKKQALANVGATPDEIYRYQTRAEAWAIAHRDPRCDTLPTLTRAQEAVLLPGIVRRQGPRCLADEDVAIAVGLSHADRASAERTILGAKLRYFDEDHRGTLATYRLAGATEDAISAKTEEYRLFRRSLAGEIDLFSPPIDRQRRALLDRAGYSTPGLPLAIIIGHRTMLTYRRKAAIVRDLNAGLLNQLKPDQRARWNALVKG